MSLIDEALKRARLEAARQEVARKEASRQEGPRPVPMLYSERRRAASKAPLWAGIASGVAVALLGILAWTFWAGGRGPAGSASPANAGSPATPGTASGPAAGTSFPATGRPSTQETPGAQVATAPPQLRTDSPPLRSDPSRASSAPSGATIPRASSGGGPATSSEAQPAPASEPALVVSSPPRNPTPSASKATPTGQPASASSTPTTPSGDAKTYIREVALPGGGPHFRLGGIAYSDDHPIALINGTAVGRGEVISGYVVRAITAEEVDLEGPVGRLVLKLK